MTLQARMLTVVTIAFFFLTAVALADVGYCGIIAPHFQSWGGAQVVADLLHLALLSCVWMVADSGSSGVPAWPVVARTFAAGSFGILLYVPVPACKASERPGAAAQQRPRRRTPDPARCRRLTSRLSAPY